MKNGRSGLLVQGHDPDDYAHALQRLVAEPGLRQALSRGAVEHAGQFGWSVTAAGVLATYRAALDDAAGAGTGRLAAL